VLSVFFVCGHVLDKRCKVFSVERSV